MTGNPQSRQCTIVSWTQSQGYRTRTILMLSWTRSVGDVPYKRAERKRGSYAVWRQSSLNVERRSECSAAFWVTFLCDVNGLKSRCRGNRYCWRNISSQVFWAKKRSDIILCSCSLDLFWLRSVFKPSDYMYWTCPAISDHSHHWQSAIMIYGIGLPGIYFAGASIMQWLSAYIPSAKFHFLGRIPRSMLQITFCKILPTCVCSFFLS
jgi:hypothetical protein